jgi:hypothetical protein
MIAAIYAQAPLAALCCLIALATPAGAEVLWERATEDPEPSAFTSLGVFGTATECRAAALSKAESAYRWHKRGQYREATMEATPDGWRVQAPVEFATLTLVYECLPDTVDPREPKGTK